MADRSAAARPSIESYAARHAGSVLVMAYLLTGDWPSAEVATAHALVRGRRTSSEADSSGAVEALVRRHVRRRANWWSQGGGLHLQEVGALPRAAVEDPGRLWPALAQLTEHERASVVLRGLGMDGAEMAQLLGRSAADVERDLDLADDVMTHADPTRPASDRDIASELRAFFAAHVALTRSTEKVEQHAAELDRRRRRTLQLSAVFGAAAAVAVASVGIVAAASQESPSAAADTLSTPTGPSDAATALSESLLPRVGTDRKLVGFRSVIVAVPASWRQVSAACDSVKRDAVVFPTGDRAAALCGDDDLASGLSAVSFNVDTAGEPEVEGEFGPRRTHGGEFIVTRPRGHGGRYVAYTAAPDLGFGMSITTGSLRTLNRIIDSITVLPAGYTTVPECIGLPSGQVEALLHGSQLVPQQLFDHSSVGLPLEVVQQSQSVGTVVPVQTRITLGMLPR